MTLDLRRPVWALHVLIVGLALHNLAIIDRNLGHLADARTGYEAALATRTQIGDKRGAVVGRVELGLVLLAQGHLDLARKSEEEALADLELAQRITPSDATEDLEWIRGALEELRGVAQPR